MTFSDAVQLSKDGDADVRAALATRVNEFGRDLLDLMSRDASPNVRLQALRTWKGPSKHLFECFGADTEAKIREAVATRLTTSEQLATLANDPADVVRSSVAASSYVDRTTRKRLALDRSPSVLAALARNPQMTEIELLRIDRLEDPAVACAVAVSVDVARETLLKLATSDDVDVLTCVASHPRLPPHVRARCIHKITRAPADGRSTDRVIIASRALAALKPQLDRTMQIILSRDRSAKVRSACAMNPDLEESCLLELAGDAAVSVRRALANRKEIPGQVRLALSRDSDQRVSRRFETRVERQIRLRNDAA